MRLICTYGAADLNVLAVVGSLNRISTTRLVLIHLAEQLKARGSAVDLLDLLDEPLASSILIAPMRPKDLLRLRARVEQADVFILGTPDYHGASAAR